MPEPRDEPILVLLESSDPSALVVFPFLTLASFSPTAQFSFRTIEDKRILDDRVVTITARSGEEVVAREVILLERNSLTPVLSGPAELLHGAGAVTFSVGFDALAETELAIGLTATPAGVMPTPAILTLPPGENTGTFSVELAEEGGTSTGTPACAWSSRT